MISQEELEQIEISNKEALIAVEKGEALKRLLDSDDYKLVFTEGYLNEYASNLGKAIARNTGQYDVDKLMENLKGINTFIGYTFAVSNAYHEASQTLRDNEAYIAQSEDQE
ncbi:MAG: hypothetical protein WC179_07755 [Candidatus Cloacimonadaceae bacterium]|jgi:hypothetical protein|nr:hypothetical protein [Kiritimatiellia bacterium]